MRPPIGSRRCPVCWDAERTRAVGAALEGGGQPSKMACGSEGSWLGAVESSVDTGWVVSLGSGLPWCCLTAIAGSVTGSDR